MRTVSPGLAASIASWIGVPGPGLTSMVAALAEPAANTSRSRKEGARDAIRDLLWAAQIPRPPLAWQGSPRQGDRSVGMQLAVNASESVRREAGAPGSGTEVLDTRCVNYGDDSVHEQTRLVELAAGKSGPRRDRTSDPLIKSGIRGDED